jgi:four helix bundle protein
MKKKTLNAQRLTFNIEGVGVREDAGSYGADSETLNAQRSTLNVQRQRERRFDLEERLLEFSPHIIELIDALPHTRAANHVAGQLLRCGTSPYGNHGEVQAAESRRDFIHKLRVCLKELKETRRWLRLIQRATWLPQSKTASFLCETEELIKIFVTSIRTAEKNAP